MAHNLVPRNSKERASPSQSQSSYDGSVNIILNKEVSPTINRGPTHVEVHALKPRRKRNSKRRKLGKMSDTSTSEGPCDRDSRSRCKGTLNLASIEQSYSRSTDEVGNANERQRLLADVNHRPNYSGQNETIHKIPTPPTMRRFLPEMNSSTKRYLSIVLFLFVLVLDIAFVISSHIKSDKKGMAITPRVVNYYVISLISVFVVWFVFERLGNRQFVKGESGSLIPSHLLSGLALFGVGSSVCQVVTILDFLKCQRHVNELDYSYLAYPFFEMAFMFLQIFVFCTLSKNRERKMLFGNVFTMFTLAVNLTIWAKYFFANAASDSELGNETWISHYHYGVLDHELCSGNRTSDISRKLHYFQSGMKPFMYTLAMEYTLLASALLLHVWLEIATPNSGEYGATNKNWKIWRVGFILGLFCLPLLSAISVNATVEFHENKMTVTIVYIAQLFLFIMLLLCSCFGLKHVRKFYVPKQKPSRIRIDIILLVISWLGFLVCDVFTIFASSVEIATNFHISILGLGIESLVELLSTGMLTTFLATAYSRRLPSAIDESCFKAAKKIRQIGSFSMIVSFGFWALRSYTFRSSHTFDFVGNEYFKDHSWFVITQLSSPFCTFFHFHSAVCFTEVIAAATV